MFDNCHLTKVPSVTVSSKLTTQIHFGFLVSLTFLCKFILLCLSIGPHYKEIDAEPRVCVTEKLKHQPPRGLEVGHIQEILKPEYIPVFKAS